MSFGVDLVGDVPAPISQLVGAKALHLRQLGMSLEEIGRGLGVSHVTAAKAVRWARSLDGPKA